MVFQVAVDSAPLIGHASGPFLLDFQFTDGSGMNDGNNTVTLGGFNFHGGGWIGADPGPITLTDSSFFSEYLQGFTPGSSLSFSVSLTTAVDAGGIPDQFSFAILDNTLSEIPTVGMADAFLAVDIDSTSPTIQTYRSDLSRTSLDIPAPTINAAVPEASTFWAGACALGVLASACGRRFSRR